MRTRIAINGFGRIGRNAFKIASERYDLEVVAINDVFDTRRLAHLLKYDSTYGIYNKKIGFDSENITVNGRKTRLFNQRNPALLPWGDLGVDIVIESSDVFTEPSKAKAHINQAGAKRVIISAPSSSQGVSTIILGVNEHQLPASLEVISAGSCTSNCGALILDIINRNFGIKGAMMTAVHSYMSGQKLLDSPAKNLREARSAAVNLIPTATGASITITRILPNLIGIFEAYAIRVPTSLVSLADFVITTENKVTKDKVNKLFKKLSNDPYYQGILDTNDQELVSSDYIGNSHSATVDLDLTDVLGDNLLKIVAWYDNEWAYSNRLVELAADVGRMLAGKNYSQDAFLEETHI